MYGLRSMCTFPNRQSLQTVPASACKHFFGKELTELADGSDYDVNACCYCRQLGDSYIAIDLGEREATPVMHAVISGPTFSNVCADWLGEYLSDFGESTITPSTQLRTLTSQRATNHFYRQAMLGATAVECIPTSATDSNDGAACNNKLVIHYEGTTGVA